MKVQELREELDNRIAERTKDGKVFSLDNDQLDEEELTGITDRGLLIKTLCVLAVVIILFLSGSIPGFKLTIGWVALMGALTVLVLQDKADLESILARVEWTTLVFFATLFVVIEALSRLGLLTFIGGLVSSAISGVSPEARLPLAIFVIVWVSGITSGFVDNIPFATMMVPIINSLSNDLDLPLQPLVYSLALGCCLGGNLTLIGASANVVCAGVAEQHGYSFTFTKFFMVGCPITIVSLAISTVYLMICHVVFEWHL